MVKMVIPLETKQILARSLDMRDAAEFKKIRRVRTRAGALFFRQPIGSVIVNDSRLENMKIKKPVFDGFETVEAPNGKLYDLGKDDDGKWTAFYHDTNRRYATAKDEESLFQVVNDKFGRRGKGTRSKKPAEPAPEVRGGEELARIFFRGDRARLQDPDTGKMVTLPVVNSGRKRKGRLQQEYVTVERPDGSKETIWEEDFPDYRLTRASDTLTAPEKAPDTPKKRGMFRGRQNGEAAQAGIDEYERQGKYGTADPREAFRLELHRREWMSQSRLEAIQDSPNYREQIASAIFLDDPDKISSFARAEAARLRRENKPGARESVVGAGRRAMMVANKPREVAIEKRRQRSQAEAAARTAAARAEQAAKPKAPRTERTPDAYAGRFGRDEFGTVAREGDMQGAADDLATGKRVDWAKYSPDQLRWLHQNLQDRLEAGEVDVATVSRYKRNMDAELRRRAQSSPRGGTSRVVPPRRPEASSAPTQSIDQLTQAVNTLKGRYSDMSTSRLRTVLSELRNNTNNNAQIVVQAIEEILAERGVAV